MTIYVLTLKCVDRPGIVAAASAALLDLGGNILENHQFTDPVGSIFCMRTRVDVTGVDVDALLRSVTDATIKFGPQWTARAETEQLRMLVMVSKHDHCMMDLLYRWRAHELPVEIPAVVSNHGDLGPYVEQFGVAFEHVPVTKETKQRAEQRLLELVQTYNVDFVVLARYMQILSDDLCAHLSGRAINIHHSFLPGFKGARPYHQAKERGVKVIGATAHYVTGELDEGPIISQGVHPVSHAHTAEEMSIIGKDIERMVLSQAVKAHAEGRVFLIENRTVVF